MESPCECGIEPPGSISHGVNTMGAAPVFIKKRIVIMKFMGEICRLNKFSRIELKIKINNNVDEA